MQSHQHTFGKDNKNANVPGMSRGHQRQQSLGKAMPVTSLLLNFPPLHRSAYYTRHERSPEHELPPLYFSISSSHDNNQHGESNKNKNNDDDDEDKDKDEDETEEIFELLVSDCSGSNNGGDGDDEPSVSLVGNSKFYTPCLTCINNAPEDLAARPSAINEMCRRLCTDECRLRLSLAGFEPPKDLALNSQNALTEYVRENVNLGSKQVAECLDEPTAKTMAPHQPPPSSSPSPNLPQTRPPPPIAIQRKKFLMELLTPNSDSDSDSNFIDEIGERKLKKNKAPATASLLEVVNAVVDNKTTDDDNSNNDDCIKRIVDPHELEMLKDFRERFEIAEALAKTSAMTSTAQIKQRLAARKLEMELETQSNNAANAQELKCLKTGVDVGVGDASLCGATNATANGVVAEKLDYCLIDDCDDCNKNGCGNCERHRRCRRHQLRAERDKIYVQTTTLTRSATDADTDMPATLKVQKQSGNDFEPPRDLLLYLVRKQELHIKQQSAT